MSTYGVTSTGFVEPSLTQIKADLTTAFQTAFGTGIDTTPTSVFGQIIGIMAERLANLWDGLAGTYAAWTADGAAGISLDNLCALTGTVRNPATYSSVSLVLVGTNGTVVPAGSAASVGQSGNKFTTLASATIATVGAWVAATSYAVGQLVLNGGNIYYCTGAGTSAGAGGPTGTGTAIADNTAVWRYIATATAAVVAASQASVTGPIIGAAGSITYVGTPVAGWNSVVNPLDATLGANVETDAALRVRRAAQLNLGGTGTINAIRSKVLAIPGVTACTVFDNPTDTTDGNGNTPHSFETLVSGSTYSVSTLLATIWQNKPAGIKASGQISGTTPDSQGNLQTVAYSVPTQQNVYVVVNLVADSSVWSVSNVAGLVSAVQAALVAYAAAAYVNDQDVIASALEAQLVYSVIAKTGIVGVLDAACNIGLAPSPTTRNTISITARQFAAISSGNVSVNVTYGTP